MGAGRKGLGDQERRMNITKTDCDLRVWGSLFLVVTLLCGGCERRKPSDAGIGDSRPTSLGAKRVTIAQYGDLLLYLPLYMAVDEGLFSKRGLDVQIVSTGGDDKTYAAVISGSAEFGLADPTFVAIAREKGQQGKVVAMLINGMPNYGVSLSTNEPVIRTPSDLKGKTVASVPAPSTSYALVKKLYESAGIPPAIRQVAAPALVPALQAKQADYAVLIEPWVSAVVQGGGQVCFSLMDFYPEFALTGLTCGKSTVESDSETVQKVLLAMTEAVHLFYTDEEVSLTVATRRFASENVDHLKKGIARMRKDTIYPSSLAVTETAWKAAIQLRQDSGDLYGAPLPLSEYADNSFAEAAAMSLMTGPR